MATSRRRHGIQAKRNDSPVVVRTGGRVAHRYFRCPEGTEVHCRSAMHKIDSLDVKGWRSYIVVAGSVHPQTRRRYASLSGKKLIDVQRPPFFDPAWAEEKIPRPCAAVCPSNGTKPSHNRIRDVQAYIRAIPSILGQGGDNACFTVA